MNFYPTETCQYLILPIYFLALPRFLSLSLSLTFPLSFCSPVSRLPCSVVLFPPFPLFLFSPVSLLAIKRLRTRFAAVRHWRDLSLSTYERDLVTNEKV